jgi:CRP-like cAMP-binding protein
MPRIGKSDMMPWAKAAPPQGVSAAFPVTALPDTTMWAKGVPAIDPLPAKGARRVTPRDGEIFGEGDAADRWYRLVSGTVRVFRVLADGRRHIGEFVHPGQFFGFEPGAVHTQSAEAVERADYLVYPIAAIERRMADDPDARRGLQALLMERLAAAELRILTLGRLAAAERLADFILAARRRSADPRVVALPMSRVDLADYLGLTVETVSRLFTSMRRRGIIRLPTANRIEILDRAALAAASGRPDRDEDDGEVEDEAPPLRRCA